MFTGTDLFSNDLLSKSLHGQKQNPSKGLNPIICIPCPKNIFMEEML